MHKRLPCPQAQVVRCHCGALQLMEWEGGGRRREEDMMEGELSCGERESSSNHCLPSPPPALPALGQACFCYLMLAVHLQQLYLPQVISHAHLLHINLRHCRTLLGRLDDP